LEEPVAFIFRVEVLVDTSDVTWRIKPGQRVNLHHRENLKSQNEEK
jgi:hypothetical protein